MRALVFAAALLLGCADTDPCAGHDGTCLGLRVAGSGRVDQLQVQLDGAAQLDGLTPPVPGPPRELPVTTAVFLPSVKGQVAVQVAGRLGGEEIGEATAQVTLSPRQHLTITLTLHALTGDLAMNPEMDLAGADLAGLDQSLPFEGDLSGEDLTGDDLSSPQDLTGDLAGTGPRRVFVLPARSAALGSLTSLDGDCTTAATIAGLGGSYRAMVAYPTDDPHSHITLGQGRDIVVPSGRKVATDSTFFTTTHASAIDQLADGTAVTGCVFTLFGPGGDRVPGSMSDCQVWSSVSIGDFGGMGDVAASDINWCLSTVDTCDHSCHVYCIEQ